MLMFQKHVGQGLSLALAEKDRKNAERVYQFKEYGIDRRCMPVWFVDRRRDQPARFCVLA